MKLKELKDFLYLDASIPHGLRWSKRMTSRALKDAPAGCMATNGYYAIHLKKRVYLNHRLIYALTYGLELESLPQCIDHIDRNKKNNQVENLRPATIAQNCSNTPKWRNSTSQFKGVYWSGNEQKWRARFHHQNKHFSLGYFKTEIEAAEAYDKKAYELYGEYAYLNFPVLLEAIQELEVK